MVSQVNGFLPRFRSLTFKFLLIFFPLTLIVVLASTTTQALKDFRSASEALRIKNIEITEFYARALASPLWNYDIETAENIVNGIVIDKDIISARLVDDKGIEVVMVESAIFSDENPENLFILERDVRIKQGDDYFTIATLTVAFTQSRLLNVLNQTIISTLVLVSILLVTNIFAAVLALRLSVIRPLSKVEEAVTQSDDKKMEKVAWASEDEIGSVIKSYNSMVEVVNESRTVMFDSIEFASLIQNSIVHSEPIEGWDYDVVWKPRDIVSGDLYFWAETEDELVLVVVDCTGHGVPGSILSAISRTIFSNIDLFKCKPGEILTEVNKKVLELFSKGNDSRLSSEVGFDGTICKINKSTGLLQYSGARNSLFLIEEGNAVKEMKVERRSVGQSKYSLNQDFETWEYSLKPGYLVMLTDGLLDAVQQTDRPRLFGKTRFISSTEKFIRNLSLSNSKQLNDNIMKDVYLWIGEQPFRDDVTMLSIKIPSFKI